MRAPAEIGRVAGFAVLAGYASWHWFALLADPPAGRWAACLGCAVAGAVALQACAGLRGRGPRRAFAAAVTGAMLAAGMLAAGVPAAMLLPPGWDELTANVASGLTGAGRLELPYAGGEEWTRIALALAVPMVLAFAAAVAFWPGSAARARRLLSLVSLVVLYGFAVTWEAPSAELARGAGLLAAIAAYEWLPRLPGRGLPAAVLAVAIAAAAAVPAAARVDPGGPLIDYASWRVFAGERAVTFDWNHAYGPLDWPQRGTELFEVEGAERPLYWKTWVMDDFDGVRWTRGDGADLGEPGIGGLGPNEARERRWTEAFSVRVRALDSPVVVTSGRTLDVAGVEAEPSDPDGTTIATEGLEEGDEYAVQAYSPRPSNRLLRRADDGRYPRSLSAYTSLLLPQRHGRTGVAPQAAPIDPLVPIAVPLRRPGGPGATMPARLIAGTPYARVLKLARRLTAAAGGNYEAALAIERHLAENYEYRQGVRDQPDPLPGFLFRDRAGYCQQFSGAMALMLRMVGIPARVVAGFAPGLPDPDRDDAYIVRDTDAHSWVEVWFPRIGWVTMDPTPAAAPARTEEALAAAGSGGSGLVSGLGRGFEIEQSASSGEIAGVDGRGGRDDDGGGGILVLAVVGAGAGMIALAWLRRRRLLSPAGAPAQLAELQRALTASGIVPAGDGATLLRLEEAVERGLGAPAARYVTALRDNRYAPERPKRPGPEQRREFRRALARGTGPLGRLRALLAVPPGGPRRA